MTAIERETAPSDAPASGSVQAAGAVTKDARPSDRDGWARPVGRLTTADGQAPLDTVRGKRPVGAIQGFGRLWQKTFRVQLGSVATPREVVAYWKEHFSELWPSGNTFYPPLTGIAPGEVALLQVGTLPGFRLSTGIVVIYVDDERFTFMTPEGHMFAGWITFGATAADGGTTAEIDVLVRGQNAISELGLTFGGHRLENRNWRATLANLAARFGAPDAPIEQQVVCVDRRYQWRHAANIRHDATFRSALFTAAAPVRWARRTIARH